MSPQKMLGVLMGVALLGLVASAGGLWVMSRKSAAAPAAGVPQTVRVPEFTLTDQDGGVVTHAVLDGRVSVVDFFFTSCPLFCPAMTAAMKRVQEGTAGTGVRLLSISIDGAHDTPEVIRAYGAGFGADFSRWTFATGPREVVWGMLTGGLSMHVGEDASMPIARPDGSAALNIEHPTRLMLVGPDRRVLGLYAYDDAAAIQALIRDAVKAAGG
jgi:cytochrome oxidase Cu insertion factor (SCO1/SenC/PrrC family)